jgi:hypothetical protein
MLRSVVGGLGTVLSQKAILGGLVKAGEEYIRKISVGDYVFCCVEKPVMGVVGLVRVIRKIS